MTDRKLLKKKEKYIREVILPSGSHVLRVEIRKNGQTFRKNVVVDDFSTPAAALAAAVRIRDRELVGIEQVVRQRDLKTVGELYEKSYDLFPVSLKTRARHDIYFRLVLEPYKNKAIQAIKTSDIQEACNKYAETHTKAESKKMLAVWKRLYKTATALEIELPDRCAGVEITGGIQEKHRKKDISQEDLERFLECLLSYNEASISGSYNCTAIYFAIRIMQFCGLRPAETFCLTRSDVDPDKMVIHVNKSVRSSRDELVTIGKTKTAGSVRDVPISAELLPIVQECLSWCRHDDLILADYNGNIFEISEVDTLIGHVRTKKCPDIQFNLYQLRHQFSTDLHRSGVPSPVVRDLMGHRSSVMTVDYAVSYEEDRKKAVNNRKFKSENE